MNRTEKADLVDSLRSTFEGSEVVVITHQTGLTVSEVEGLRSKVREAGAGYKVTKNRLARLALQGTRYENLSDLFTGPTSVTTSSDPVAAAKVIVEFANSNDKVTIIGGGLGERALSVDEVKALAKTPSLDESRAKLVGLLQTPASRMVGVLVAPAGQVARVLAARGEQSE
ncbi:MAG: 50S ribosomal protein L10 [Alphaproteobacteria bacterium]|nr:50S ribosomal protein L10 [Alphaproteobacteria bacterium]